MPVRQMSVSLIEVLGTYLNHIVLTSFQMSNNLHRLTVTNNHDGEMKKSRGNPAVYRVTTGQKDVIKGRLLRPQVDRSDPLAFECDD